MDDRLPFEIVWHGAGVQLLDTRASSEVGRLLGLIEHAFTEAATAVILVEASPGSFSPEGFLQQWHSDFWRRAELQGALEAGAGAGSEGSSRVDRERLAVEADRRLVIEKLERGILPNRMQHMIPFILAKAFVYAADEIGKLLEVLARRVDLPAAAKAACSGYRTAFPDLRQVRDSIQHLEDRGRGLRRGKKALKLKPVDNEMAKAPGGMLLMPSLIGNKFGVTMADGRYGSVEVSQATLGTIRDRIEAVLAALPWQGPARRFP